MEYGDILSSYFTHCDRPPDYTGNMETPDYTGSMETYCHHILHIVTGHQIIHTGNMETYFHHILRIVTGHQIIQEN